MELEEKLCDEVEKGRVLTYLGDRVSAGGGCEAAVTARTRCGLVRSRECGELLCGRRFPLKLKMVVYKGYVGPATEVNSNRSDRSEAWCLKESEMGILLRKERSIVRATCGVQIKDRKRSTDLMSMFD